MITSGYSKFHRHTIRLAGYDYSQPGSYFITICTRDWNPLFGNAVDHQIRLNERGRVARACWLEIPVHFPNIGLDEFVVMPDHIHGIIVIIDLRAVPQIGESVVGAQHAAPLQPPLPAPLQPGSIPVIVRSYKSAVTKRIHEIIGMDGIPVWQRNYWEHIIRNDNEMERIRYYIRTNPIHRRVKQGGRTT
jgi:putative transposase